MSFTMMNDTVMGHKLQPTPTVDPIGIGVDYYKWGNRTATLGNFPRAKKNIRPYWAGSRDPKLRISHAEYFGNIAFSPVNGIPWYYALGARADAGGGINRITGIDIDSNPVFVNRSQDQNGTISTRETIFDNKMKMTTFDLVDLNTNVPIPAVMGVGFMGLDLGTPADTADHDPIFADSIGQDLYYKKDSNFEFKWDFGEAGEVEYKDQIIDFKYTMDATSRFSPIIQQMNPDLIIEGVRNHILTFSILRGGDTTIYDDFKAQNRSSTGKALRLKVHASSSIYQQFDWDKVFMEVCNRNDGDETKGDEQRYDVLAFAQSVIIDAKDGITTAAFYGD